MTSEWEVIVLLRFSNIIVRSRSSGRNCRCWYFKNLNLIESQLVDVVWLVLYLAHTHDAIEEELYLDLCVDLKILDLRIIL